MRPTFPKQTSPIALAIAFAIILGTVGFAFSPPAAKAQEVVGIQLKDGRFLEAIISGIEDDQVKWRSPSGAPTQPIPYEKIDMIHFTPTAEWAQAMELFENGDLEKAVEIFQPISVDVTVRTYYPAPGNFATLAQRRLLDCYRALSLPNKIAYIQESIQWDKLPSHERNLAAIIELWAAVGNGKWEQGVEAAETARKAYRTTDPEVNEIGFLLGAIYKKLEDQEKALVYFGEGYGLVTSNPRLAATSMIEAAGILSKIVPDFPERESELKATLHLYAELIGKGELWEGAEPVLVALFKRKDGTPEVKPPPGDGPPPGDAKKDK